jgi:putative hydrolase of the HAD superfamily
MPGALGAVLFDWRGTLFHDEDDAAWIRASAASIGQTLTTQEVNARVEMLGAAAEHPQVVAARRTADCSAELHRAAVLLELRLAGFDDALAQAICDRDGDLGATVPYSDTPAVLERLKAFGLRIGIVSDIHYPLRPHFDHYWLGTFVDSYTLSFEHGVQKPHPRLFQIALEQLGVTPRETLMVGDRAVRDGGAASVGIATLILPPVPNHTPRGLDIVLRLLSSA